MNIAFVLYSNDRLRKWKCICNITRCRKRLRSWKSFAYFSSSLEPLFVFSYQMYFIKVGIGLLLKNAAMKSLLFILFLSYFC